jgi:cell division protein FtsW (lipid II flippase)
MNFYNKVMLYFWLAAAVIIFIITSYMSYSEGIKKWGFYYIFVASALLMFLVKRWMMKRMAKHLNYLEEQKMNKK